MPAPTSGSRSIRLRSVSPETSESALDRENHSIASGVAQYRKRQVIGTELAQIDAADYVERHRLVGQMTVDVAENGRTTKRRLEELAETPEELAELVPLFQLYGELTAESYVRHARKLLGDE